MSDEPMLTSRQRQKVWSEVLGLIGPHTKSEEASVIRFVAIQVGRQTREEAAFCRHTPRGRP